MDRKTLFLADAVLTTELSICNGFRERARGLLFRPPLRPEQGEALLIPRCNSIHTFGMSYPISVLFLNRHRRIVRIYSEIKPMRIAGKLGADCAIECTVGTAWVNQLNVGDQLRW